MRICLSLFYALWTLFLHILQVLFKGARNEHSKNCVEINVFLYILEKKPLLLQRKKGVTR